MHMRLRRTYLTFGVLSALVLVAPVAAVRAAPATREASRPRTVRLTFRDGSSQFVRLDGVGCDESICSRTVVNTRTVASATIHHTRLDDVVAVQSINDAAAVFAFKDGSTQRLAV